MDYQAEKAQERAAISKLGIALQGHLTDWHLLPGRPDHDQDAFYARFAKDGMEFNISKDNNSRREARWSVSSWTWPSYTSATKTVHNWDRDSSKGTEIPATETVNPHNLYDPREDYPSITISASKSPEQIAKDITRRFIPEYERIYKRCKEKADNLQQYEDKVRDNWQRICQLLNEDPKHSVAYFKGKGTWKGFEMRLEQRGDTSQATFDCNAAMLERLMKVLEVPEQ